MIADRSIAEGRTLQCSCGKRLDVVEWYVVDVARRMDLVVELADGGQRSHRCSACWATHDRLVPLGLLVPSNSGPVIALVGEFEGGGKDSAWYATVQLEMFDEPVAFVNVPWRWIELILDRDFDADLGDPARARAQVAMRYGAEPASGYAGALRMLRRASERFPNHTRAPSTPHLPAR